jgi:hypothetical protein
MELSKCDLQKKKTCIKQCGFDYAVKAQILTTKVDGKQKLFFQQL